MVRGGKRSAEEELAYLRQRALQLQMKQTRGEIISYLDEFPELAHACLKYLEDASGNKRPEKKKRAEGEPQQDRGDPAEVAFRTPTKLAARREHSTVNAGMATRAPSRQIDNPAVASEDSESSNIPICHLTVSSIPPKYIQEVISRMGEVSLSKSSLRALRKKRGRYPSKKDLLELFEALTGMEPEDTVQPAFRNNELLVEAMKHRHSKMNRWARHLTLPANWSSQGIYELVEINDEKGQSIRILHKPLQKYHVVNTKLVPDSMDINAMHIEKNFSERRAQLVDKNGAFRCLIVVLCPSVQEDFTPLIWNAGDADDDPFSHGRSDLARSKDDEGMGNGSKGEKDSHSEPEGVGTAAAQDEDFVPPADHVP